MDIRTLETFIQVAELKSFTRAGEKLGYSQPTVSFQINKLERELGEQLFERIGHTVSLTDAGQDALAYAQQICRMQQQMVLGKMKRTIACGEIALGMAESLCSPLIEEGFLKFRKEYPGISLRIITAGTDELFRLLDHNEVDLLCTLDSHIYNASYIIANEEKIGVHFVASANHPLTRRKVGLRELAQQPLLRTEKGMSYGRLMDELFARHSLEAQPVLEIGSPQLISRLVEENAGIAFLPDYVTREAISRGSLRYLDVEGLEIDLWKQLLYHRDKWISLQMQAVLSHLSGITLNPA